MGSLKPPRSTQDIQGYLAGLEAVLAKSHGGWADEESLLEFRRLCLSARLVAEDSDCHQQFDLLAQYAKDLYSDHAHHRWDIGPVFGADILRRKIRMTLSACRARVNGVGRSFNSTVPGLPAALLRQAFRALPT